MKKQHIVTIILFVILGISIILDKIGFTLISRVVGGVFTIVTLILRLDDIKAMNKKLLATALTINLVPGCVLLYTIFMTTNSKLMYGSMICFFISIPVALVVVEIYRRKLNG